MSKLNKHKTEVQGENIIIKLNIDQLIFGIENNPNFPCKITDKNKFIKYIVDNFFEFTSDNYNDPDPIFLKTFDDVVFGAWEEGEEFVEYIDEEDEDWD